MTPEQALRVLDDLIDRFQGTAGPNSTKNFYDRVMKRRTSFHNQSPTLLKGRLKDITPFESTAPIQKWSELRSRITENHFVVRINPIQDTATQRNDANEAEAVFNAGVLLVEEKNGYSLQEAMADAQIIDGVGMLHWRKADEVYPEYPEAEELADLPDDPDEAKRFTSRRKGGVYKEKPESVKERRAYSCAKAGFPWIFEVPDILSCLWDQDDFGLSVVAYIREMAMFTYAREEDPEAVSVAEATDGADRIYRGRPLLGDMSSIQPSDRVAVVTIWTRSHWYEFYQPTYSGTITKGAAWIPALMEAHEYGEPPFALVPAIQLLNRAPEDAFLPALEPMLQLKAATDRAVTLMTGLQEQAAIGMYYLARIGTGEPLLGEDGDEVVLSADAAAAYKVPDGYELRELRPDVSPGYVSSVQFLDQKFNEASPKTGRTEITGSSSPWTVRFGLEQENVEPRHLLRNQLAGLTKMFRSVARYMSMEEEPTYVFAKVQEGLIDKKKVLALEPKKIGSLDISVEIDPTSQAERVSLIEHGSALLERGLIDDIDFLSNYMKVQNPDKVFAQREAFKHFKANVFPQLLKMETAKLLAPMYVLGVNGEFIGPGGQPAAPEDVLAANGQPSPYGGQNPPPPQPMGGVQGGGALAPTLPDLPALTPPNMAVMPGMPG